MLDSGFLRRPCVACLVVSVVIAGGFTPGPIPNPEAKAPSADGTALARVWESRTPPSTHVESRGRGPRIDLREPRPLACFLRRWRCTVRRQIAGGCGISRRGQGELRAAGCGGRLSGRGAGRRALEHSQVGRRRSLGLIPPRSSGDGETPWARRCRRSHGRSAAEVGAAVSTGRQLGGRARWRCGTPRRSARGRGATREGTLGLDALLWEARARRRLAGRRSTVPAGHAEGAGYRRCRYPAPSCRGGSSAYIQEGSSMCQCQKS